MALAAIAQEGTFGAAARTLGYTQSAISQQIAGLERAVGAKVLHRPGGPRPVTLTEAGELLLGHADAIRARLQAAQADFEALQQGAAGTLRIGTYQSVGTTIVPAVLQRMRRDWPGVTIELHEAAGDQELLDGVERGELDITFTVFPLMEGPLTSREVLRDPRVLIAPLNSPYADRESAPALSELQGEPMISFKDTCCRDVLFANQHMEEAGLRQNVVFRTEDNGMLQGLVAAGMGIAIVPRLVIDVTRSDVVSLSLNDQLPPRRIALAWHEERYRPAAAEAFIECASDVCASLSLDITTGREVA